MSIKYALVFSGVMEHPRYVRAKDLQELFGLIKNEIEFAIKNNLGELELMYRIY